MNLAVKLEDSLRREGVPHELEEIVELRDIHYNLYYPSKQSPLLVFSLCYGGRFNTSSFKLNGNDNFIFSDADAHDLIIATHLRAKPRKD